MSQVPRWRRIVRAAGRLAAIYVVTTLILLLAALSLIAGIRLTLSDLGELWLPLGVAFLFAFLLLAVARRAGLVGLWVILFGLWLYVCWEVSDVVHSPMARGFVVWTILSLPLYVMGMIGAPTSGRLLRRSSLVAAILWFCLIGAAFAAGGLVGHPDVGSGVDGMLRRSGNVMWTAFPFLLCVHEIVRVWKATAETSPAA